MLVVAGPWPWRRRRGRRRPWSSVGRKQGRARAGRRPRARRHRTAAWPAWAAFAVPRGLGCRASRRPGWALARGPLGVPGGLGRVPRAGVPRGLGRRAGGLGCSPSRVPRGLARRPLRARAGQLRTTELRLVPGLRASRARACPVRPLLLRQHRDVRRRLGPVPTTGTVGRASVSGSSVGRRRDGGRRGRVGRACAGVPAPAVARVVGRRRRPGRPPGRRVVAGCAVAVAPGRAFGPVDRVLPGAGGSVTRTAPGDWTAACCRAGARSARGPGLRRR